jgi:hypothetical protein
VEGSLALPFANPLADRFGSQAQGQNFTPTPALNRFSLRSMSVVRS